MKLSPKTLYWIVMVTLVLVAIVVSGLLAPSTQTATPPTEQETVTPNKTPSSDKTDKPDSTGVDNTNVEIQRRFDALRDELRRDALRDELRRDALRDELRRDALRNERRRELLDYRADTINWWLTATAIFLAFFAFLVVIVGYFGYNKFQEFLSDASDNVEKVRGYAKEAQELVEKIGERKREDEETNQYIQRERHEASSDKAEQLREPGQEDEQVSDESSFAQAISDALTLEQEGKIEEAIEKWRSIAEDAEGSHNDLAASVWLYIATLLQKGDEDAEEQ